MTTGQDPTARQIGITGNFRAQVVFQHNSGQFQDSYWSRLFRASPESIIL
jgi:hypothetical protein